ncbi:hypothetical protein ACIG0C_05810 [Kitasatospora aureofaciens]|uniref:Secreted protein n=1 Tax=Kitasatospora aureofaciens TaxID=1894 RepID=A0A1E7N7X8_KITAU|nr:hypothetical protein [Kitasatospora aureofaciens]OEV36744.1 hypothetical protein HS99_0027385 [Kitasatospora aureofaciens]QEU98114.1 hypothetical protein CP971_01045 [Streptomyces viridifaciens]UKZ03976.1 hypothetical protein BOQ63_007865 [Streptomyces viridifaciens]GGU69784.1 hypothetical protein GCM10010502_21340 [Kitasatospora aureofaciens]
MTKKPYRLAAAATALLVAAPLFTACKNADQALDCGKRAISLTGDVQDLTDSAINVGQITDEGRRKHTVDALKRIVDDVKKIRKDGDGKLDVAADKLSKAVDKAQDAVSLGKEPDFAPIGDAAAELTKACAGA